MSCKSMRKTFLSILALSLALVLFFNVSAMAGSELKCNGELPGGYTFSGPEEITVHISLTNTGDEDFPGPVVLFYPDRTPVKEFGSRFLAAKSTQEWEGTWQLTEDELSEGIVAFYVNYPYKDENTGEITTKTKKLKFKISYTGSESDPDAIPENMQHLADVLDDSDELPVPDQEPSARPFENFTLRNSIHFGESPAGVKGKETLSLSSEDENGLVYRGTVASYEGTVEFIFSGTDGLTDMCYEIAESGNSFSHESIYDSLKAGLVKKYGDPLALPDGKLHPVHGKAYEKVFAEITASLASSVKSAKIVNYDEWLLEFDDCAVKIDLIDSCSGAVNDMEYRVLLSYHFASGEEINKIPEEDRTEAIDKDI